ncbi:tubby C 2 protein [Trifolium pratense]|uniref:Tubby C 2 protein n=1 Tax=Trifolium pratense TaxID=57577 RepID=A0A2K3MC47_TRIPR|nr:tubby C 2 protein [Trifolium pratense]PNX86130.1 tubby C 2 protein [Trifolium pratense]PNX88352.1 tubby C 2 protein [Trifolium pratense]
MAPKVYPNQESTTSSQSQSHNQYCLSSKRETYTLWMKSLVLHSNGCTVYDSNGHIVYRVDNYDRKGKREVNLMDQQGNLLCTIKKRLLALGCWEGHKYCSKSNSRSQEQQPWFEVKKCLTLTGKIACEIKAGSKNLCIERISIGKSIAFRIVNKLDGQIIAEGKQKQSSSGVVLSNDVLTLDLAAGTDHSLIMALITVYGLICGKM